MTPLFLHPHAIAENLIRIGQEEELREALAIIADMTAHPDHVVVTAARTILKLAQDDGQIREAFRALRLLDRLELIP